MMRQQVLKYDIKNCGKTTLNLPVGASVCKVEYQGAYLRIWALANVSHPRKEQRTFEVVATGQQFGGANDTGCHCYVETVFEGQFVWHIFEVLGDE